MTKTSPIKIMMLTLAGLALGLLLYLFYFVGGALTLAGFLVERATIPVPPPAQSRATPVSMDQELLAFISDVSLGGVTSISEAAFNRLTAAGLAETNFPDQFSINELAFDLEPASLTTTMLVTLNTETKLLPRMRLRPVAGRVTARFQAHPGNGALLVSLKGIRLGRLTLPMGTVERILKSYDPTTLGLPAIRESSLSYSIPYGYLATPLPKALNLESLEIRRDSIAARLRVDKRLESAILDQTSPLLREQGSQLVAAVAAAFPEGQEKLKSRVSRLASLGEADAVVPEEPSALVSYIENEVWAAPPAGERFIPDIGTDLISGTTIETGTAALMEIILADRSMLKIGENTRFVLEVLPDSESQQPKGRFALLAGTVRGKVAKILTPDFAFSTPSAVCGVRGTDLLISLSPKRELSLSVLEGSVALIPAAGDERLVADGEYLRASHRQLSRRNGPALEPQPMTAALRQAFEGEMGISTSPDDAAAIRESKRFWLTVEELKGVITGIMALDPNDRERLGKELEARLDPDAIDRRFRTLMQNDEFASMIDSFGIEGVPYP